MSHSVIVIGAGIGGLAAAVRLAHAGCEVTVLEKNSQVGGLLRDVQARGFRWNLGAPALYALRQLKALFDDCGRNLADYLRLLPLEPQTRFFYADGAVFNLRRDWTATAAEIARIQPDDVAGYLGFLAFAARLHAMRNFGFGEAEAAPGTLLGSWLRAGPFRSAHSASRRFLRSEKLQRALAYCLSHSGGSAFAVPAAFCELAHPILSDGLWVPPNGSQAIPQALAKLAAELDVAIRLGCPVKRIVIERNQAIGVESEADGEILRADAIVSNLDPVSTARYLLPEGAISPVARRRLAQTPMSSSAIIMLLGVRGTVPRLAHHNVFFSADARAESDQLFKRALMPDDPTISLTVACRTDPQSAPVNQENWLIQVDAPPLSPGIDWSTQAAIVRDRLLNKLEVGLGLELRERIRAETLLTPADLARSFGKWRGALHGELPHGRRAALSQPQIRSRYARRLYQVGNAVVAGGRLPHALLSAEAAVAALRRDLN